MDQNKLVISYSNEAPIELNTLTNSLKAIGTRYKKHLKQEDVGSSEDTNLYIREIKKGSIIVELVQAAVPVLSDVNTMASFFTSLKALIDYFSSASKSKQKPQELMTFKKSDYQEIRDIMAPAIVANGDINIYIGNNSSPSKDEQINIKSIDAFVMDKVIGKEIELLKEPEVEIRERSFMNFSHASSAGSGFRGKDLDDDITSKPIKFEPLDLYKEVSDIDGNVFRSIFKVDLKVINKGGQIKEYVVTKVHGRKKFED